MASAVVVALAALLALTPLIFHEVGHWVALRRLDVEVKEYWLGLGPAVLKWGRLRVGLLPIGGAVVPDPLPYAALTHKERMQVALAGPAASLLYGVIALLVFYGSVGLQGVQGLKSIAMLNFLLAAVNLVPIPPLDGFQALSSWMEHRKTPFSNSTLNITARLGNGLVYGVGFFVLGMTLIRH